MKRKIMKMLLAWGTLVSIFGMQIESTTIIHASDINVEDVQEVAEPDEEMPEEAESEENVAKEAENENVSEESGLEENAAEQVENEDVAEESGSKENITEGVEVEENLENDEEFVQEIEVENSDIGDEVLQEGGATEGESETADFSAEVGSAARSKYIAKGTNGGLTWSVPDSATVWGKHYYQRYDLPMTWYEAKCYCENLRGHLVTITSSEEQSIVESIIGYGLKNFYWMGMERNENGEFSYWITGEDMDYTSFDENNSEPNNCTGEENVLVIYRIANPLGGYNSQNKWNDLQADGECYDEEFFGFENSGFICEWESKTDEQDKYSCIITFNSNGGKVSEKTRSISVGETYGTLPSASRSGYNFTGWYTAKNGGKKISATTKVSKKEKITLYAHWSVKTSIKKADIKVAACTYNGKRQKPTVVVKLGKKTLKENKDFTVKYSNNINAGNVAMVTIAGKEEYRDSTSKKFKIRPLSIEKKTYIKLTKDSYTWDGKEKKPGVAVYAAITLPGSTVVTLQNKKDYTYKYKNNKEIGKASVIITGKGNYSGTKTISYKINKAEQPAKVNLRTLKKTYNDVKKSYAITVSEKKEFAKVTYISSNKKVADVSKNKIVLKGGGKATISVKFAETKHYKASMKKIFVVVLKKQDIQTQLKDKAKVGYTVNPISLGAEAKGKLSYKSSDTQIASVDQNGNLILKNAKKLGRVTVEIRAKETADYTKTVKKLKITTVKGTPVINCDPKKEHDLSESEFNLGASCEAPLSYKSSDDSIVQIDENGTVRFKEWTDDAETKDVIITISSQENEFYKTASKEIDLTIKNGIAVIKRKYPVGKYWNHEVKISADLADNLRKDYTRYSERFADEVTDHPCKNHPESPTSEPIPGAGEYDCNKFDGAIQCMGFARKVFYDLWGQRVTEISSTITNQEVQPGDYVDLSTDKTPHYGVVTKVIDSNSFETIECNIFGAPCKIIAMTRQKSDVRGIVRSTKAR